MAPSTAKYLHPTRLAITLCDQGMMKRTLSPALQRAALNQAGLVSYHQVIAEGYPSNFAFRQVARGLWRHPARNVYDVMPLHPWPGRFEHARLRSAWLGLLAVRRSISVGQCALALHGIWGLPQRLVPEVSLPGGTNVHGPAGVRVRRYRGFPVQTLHGRLIATPIAGLTQALPELTRDSAVAVLDSALQFKKITHSDLAVLDAALKGRRGAKGARQWLSLANGRAESPFETLTRLQCLDAGLDKPVLQVRIRDATGRVIARGDLGWQVGEDDWVLVDLDGKKYHEAPPTIIADRHRQNAIALTSRHTHLRFSWADLHAGTIPRVVARALAAKRSPGRTPSRTGGYVHEDDSPGR